MGVKEKELVADSDRAGFKEKFKPIHVSDNVVALKTYTEGYVSCDKKMGLFNQGGIHTDAPEITDSEMFYVY